MKDIIGFLIFCGLTRTIAAASREDFHINRRFKLSPSSEYPQRYLSRKWPTYSYKPYYRPRPSYTIPVPIDKPYKPAPVKKPAYPNTTNPSYQHISKPIGYDFKPPTPTSNYLNLANTPVISYQQTRPSENSIQNYLDYPNRPYKPHDLYNPSYQIYGKPKPKPTRPTNPSEHSAQNLLDYPNLPNKPDDPSNLFYQPYKPYPTQSTHLKPIHTISSPHAYNRPDSNDPLSYQGLKPMPVYQVYPSYPGASSDRPESEVPYPQFLQEPSNTYEDEYPIQFHDTHQKEPVEMTHLSQYLQNDNTWKQDELAFYDRVVFYPYEQNYVSQRPNGYDEIYDYPEIIEDLDEAIFETEPQQARSTNDAFEKSDAHPRGLLVPYKTFEYNPSAHNLLKIWKSKFYHPYKWWSHKKPQHIYYLQNKLHKPLLSHSRPYGYLNSDSSYPWGHLPLLSTRPASVHRIQNFAVDEPDSSIKDNYSDQVLINYLDSLEENDSYFKRSATLEKPQNFYKIRS